MPTFYIASSLKNATEVYRIIKYIESNTVWRCALDWTKIVVNENTSNVEKRDIIVQELSAVKRADVVILLFPIARGSHVELGCAIDNNKNIVAIGTEDKSCLAYSFFDKWYLTTYRLVEDLLVKKVGSNSPYF